jgi:hypothetical protein
MGTAAGWDRVGVKCAGDGDEAVLTVAGIKISNS